MFVFICFVGSSPVSLTRQAGYALRREHARAEGFHVTIDDIRGGYDVLTANVYVCECEQARCIHKSRCRTRNQCWGTSLVLPRPTDTHSHVSEN